MRPNTQAAARLALLLLLCLPHISRAQAPDSDKLLPGIPANYSSALEDLHDATSRSHACLLYAPLYGLSRTYCVYKAVSESVVSRVQNLRDSCKGKVQKYMTDSSAYNAMIFEAAAGPTLKDRMVLTSNALQSAEEVRECFCKNPQNAALRNRVDCNYMLEFVQEIKKRMQP